MPKKLFSGIPVWNWWHYSTRMHRYILAIDQGTTGTTALLFDRDLNIHGKANVEFPQHFPEPNWVEHDLDEIWKSVGQAIFLAMSQKGVKAGDIAGIGITNQRETTCLWSRGRDATPVGRAIVWQDRRTADACAKLRARGLEKAVNKKTGLLLDPYFSATKLEWMLKNIPGAMAKAKIGEIAFGTIDSYLLYRMTGVHATDVSNASRTLLMDLKTCRWDEDMLKLFKIPKAILPTILPSSVEYGKTKGFFNLPDGIPVCGISGDQQSALFGQACFTKGSVKCTYGTGAFILANVGKTPVYSKHRLLSTVAWKFGNETTYGLEGSAFIAGAAVQWLRDGLKILAKSEDVEKYASEVTSSDGVLFVPALSGFGAPHWLANATGLITGLTRRTTRGHLCRATLEGVGYQVAELLTAMSEDLKKKLGPVRVDGGASADDLLMQFQADLLNTEVIRAEILETTALGAGLQAGLTLGIWKNMDDINKTWRSAASFKPEISPKIRAQLMGSWSNAVEAVRLLSGEKKKR